ncbi:hypothetical protein YC2023_099263 [Brassica napus]
MNGTSGRKETYIGNIQDLGEEEISGTADLKSFAEDSYINESKEFLLPHRRLRVFFSIKPHIILSQSVPLPQRSI